MKHSTNGKRRRSKKVVAKLWQGARPCKGRADRWRGEMGVGSEPASHRSWVAWHAEPKFCVPNEGV